jgi:diguanylate cyclase (GGDEF)-like protein
MGMPKFKHERPTIGILAGWSAITGEIADHYLASILGGIHSAARIRGCHLLLAWGVGRVSDSSATHTAWPAVAPDSDFVPVGPWNTDGLIVFAPLLHPGRSRYLQELIAQGFPILFIASGEIGPMVSADNELGIHQAVRHLMGHGHRRIAFIAGDPGDPGDSRSRLSAYHSAIAEYGLESDPGLVVAGWHNSDGGYAAVQQILDSGSKFSALVASDDSSAIGAMNAIRDAGLQIPGDIAVIGFDDQPDAVAQVPPLASVHIPLLDMGEQALVLMVDHLTSGRGLESVELPTRLAARQSCGCLPDVVSSAGWDRSRRGASQPTEPPASGLSEIKRQLVEEMTAVLPAQSRFPYGERTRRLCLLLVEAFLASLEKGDPAAFQTALMEFLRELELADENINPWQAIISVLRGKMLGLPASWKRTRTRRLAEDLLHQARAAISESAQRQDHRHHYLREIAAQSLSVLSARLSTILDESQTVRVLEEHLPAIGVRHAQVAIFEAEGQDPVAWSLMLNADLDATSQRFPSREFPPPLLYPPDELLNLALVPLVFQEERLGYVAFDAANLGPCANVARELAASLKVARLHAQVTELSLTDPLTGVYNRRHFDLFLKNEVDRSHRFKRGLAIVLLDIDHFKEYNDSFGHPAGDKALQFVANCLRGERRSADVVARIGGEEFALILPETEIHGALKVAGKVRAAMAGPSELKRPITLSMGISVLQEGNAEPDLLMQQADSALYKAKGMGRDRVCIFVDNQLVDIEPAP